ncbi:hypothetical protein [Mycolicibacterium peregrinum]|uniref:hypothetical protein n=1 Tax=Mycolicibacterium peregrinum TaxID=43304 RepID=UPI003AAD39E0
MLVKAAPVCRLRPGSPMVSTARTWCSWASEPTIGYHIPDVPLYPWSRTSDGAAVGPADVTRVVPYRPGRSTVSAGTGQLAITAS